MRSTSWLESVGDIQEMLKAIRVLMIPMEVLTKKTFLASFDQKCRLHWTVLVLTEIHR